MVQISSSLKSCLSGTLIRAVLQKLEQGGFEGQEAGVSVPPDPPEVRYLLSASKGKDRKFALLGSGGGSNVVSWSALWRREGGGDAMVTDMWLVVFM